MLRPRPWSDHLRRDDGTASLEFLTVGVLLLVPLVYLVLAVAAIQAGALGVEGAARQAARVAVLGGDKGASDAAVERAVRVTLDDYGIRCAVRARVDLPLVPDVLTLSAIGSVPIEASATQTVSRFAGRPQ